MPVIIFSGRLAVKLRELEIFIEDVAIFGGNALAIFEGRLEEVIQSHSERLAGDKLDELGEIAHHLSAIEQRIKIGLVAAVGFGEFRNFFLRVRQ